MCCLVAVYSVGRAETHDTQQPVHIQADKMLASPKNQFIIFQGNVKVTQENIQLNADTLDVYLISSVNTVNITKESVQKINAKGHVRIHWKEYRIEADSAIYFPPKNQLVISGNMARLYQGKNNIAGSTIILDLTTDQIEISSKKGEQVEANYEFSDQDYKQLKRQ
jgi:lipopolysaccharide transport protein LptA